MVPSNRCTRQASTPRCAATWPPPTGPGPAADLLPVVLLAVLTAMVTSVIFEFGPLWLVALSAAAVLYRPFWAGLVSTFGLGGLLAGRIKLDRPATWRRWSR